MIEDNFPGREKSNLQPLTEEFQPHIHLPRKINFNKTAGLIFQNIYDSLRYFSAMEESEGHTLPSNNVFVKA